MSTPDEIWKERLAQAPKLPDRKAQLGILKYAGDSISRLKADPNWEIYGRYIEGQIKSHQLQANSCEDKLLNMFLKPEDYGQIKVKHTYNQGWVDALEFCLSIAQTLIEEGEKALEESSALTTKGDQA